MGLMPLAGELRQADARHQRSSPAQTEEQSPCGLHVADRGKDDEQGREHEHLLDLRQSVNRAGREDERQCRLPARNSPKGSRMRGMRSFSLDASSDTTERTSRVCDAVIEIRIVTADAK